MPSMILNVADAIAADLNGHDFGQAFTAVRCYQPLETLKKLKGLKVWIVPAKPGSEMATRGHDEHRFTFHVAVQCGQAKYDDIGKLDGLIELTESIAAWLRGRQLAGNPSVTVVAAAVDDQTLWVPEHLMQFDVFTSVIVAETKVAARRD